MEMPSLEQMSFEDLKAWVSDRLQERGAAGAGIDRRMDEPPHLFLLNVWRSGNDDFRKRLERVCSEVVKSVATDNWVGDHVHNLGRLIEEAEMFRVIDDLQAIVYSRAWLDGRDGTQRHMIALRALLGLGWKADPNFWIAQHKLLNRQFPELAFRGLLGHGLGPAFRRLGEIVSDRAEMQRVLMLFPSILSQQGLQNLIDAVREAKPCLTREAAEEIVTWARRRGYQEIVEVFAVAPTKEQMPSVAHRGALGITSLSRQDPGWGEEPSDPARALAGSFVTSASKEAA